MKILLSELINLLFIYYIFISFFRIYKIIYSFIWIQNNKKNKYIQYNKNIKIYILIPVLNEEKIIKDTYLYFSYFINRYKNIKLVFITTSKERENTIKILKEDIVKEDDRVIHYHYKGDGVMSHQLNYAINKINNIEKNRYSEIFIAVYNADSRPNKKTFDYIFSQNLIHKNVFQQYSDYTLNYKTFPDNFFINSILFSSSIWQNRWSLGVEFYRGIKYLKNKWIFKPLSYCIGHGLFIKLSLLNKVGLFREDTRNEDLVMGFILNNLNEKIYPIPYLDYSETPNTINSLFVQQSNWIFGPMQFYTYYKIVLKNKFYKSKLMLIVYTFKLLKSFIAWFLGPSIFIFLFVYSLFYYNYLILFLLIYLLFLFIPNLISFILMEYLSSEIKKDKKIILSIKILIGSFFAYLIYGLSGYYGIYKNVKNKIF